MNRNCRACTGKKLGKKAYAFDPSIQKTDLCEFQASQGYTVKVIRETLLPGDLGGWFEVGRVG